MRRWLWVAAGLMLWPGLGLADSVEESLQKGVQACQRGAMDEGIAQFTQAIALKPDCAHALYLRGVVYFQKGDVRSAIADETEVIRLDDKHWAAHKLRALAYLVNQQFDQAIGGFTDAIRINPKDGSFYRHRAEAYTGKGDYARATQDYSDSFNLSPAGLGDPYVLTSRARMYARKGDLELALKDLDDALRNAPVFVPAYHGRAAVHGKKKEYEKATADLQAALRLAPNDPEAVHSLAWCWATCPDAKLRQGKQAVEYALRLCVLSNWKNAAYLETLAAGYAESGQFDEAVRCEKQALELAPAGRAEEFKRRLKLYEEKKPFRDE